MRESATARISTGMLRVCRGEVRVMTFGLKQARRIRYVKFSKAVSELISRRSARLKTTANAKTISPPWIQQTERMQQRA